MRATDSVAGRGSDGDGVESGTASISASGTAAASARLAAVASHTGHFARDTNLEYVDPACVGSCVASRCQPSLGGSACGNAAKAADQSAGASVWSRGRSASGMCVSSGPHVGGLEQLAQAAAAARELRFGKAGRAIHQRGNLVMGVALGVVQPQHAPGGVRQRVQRALQLRGIGGRGRRRGVVFQPLVVFQRDVALVLAAADVLQDTMLKLFDRLGDFRGVDGAPFWAWLRRVAVNEALMRLRRGTRRSGRTA